MWREILADHHGTGLADLLMLSAVGEDRPHFVWVLTANERAQAFYRRHGFDVEGRQRHDAVLDADETLMVRLGGQLPS